MDIVEVWESARDAWSRVALLERWARERDLSPVQVEELREWVAIVARLRHDLNAERTRLADVPEYLETLHFTDAWIQSLETLTAAAEYWLS